MATGENTTPAMEKALNAAQGMFTANPRFLAPQAKHILQAQERFFDEAEKFSSAWFQRRQQATQSMIDAGRQIASEGQADPASAMKAIIGWQTHSMARMKEDVASYAEMLRRCAGMEVKEEAETAEDPSKTMKRATATSNSKPV